MSVVAGWALAAIGTMLAATGDEPTPRRFEFRQTHMGSEFKLVLYTSDDQTARRASDAAFARIAVLDRALSDYDPDSELMRLCERAGEPAVAVGDDLFRVLESAQEMSRQSAGAFDVSVGPVVRLWRRARRTKTLPDPETLARARALVGYRNLELDPSRHQVRLLKPGMRLDLGGIAKGFAAAEAIAVLKQRGIGCALVAAAGDIVVGDAPPGERGWRVGVAPLDDPTARPSRFLTIAHAAVSTSGDAERFVEIAGARYSHIVDPRTGLGVIDRSSVTVVAADGATADSLATAVYVLGPERGLKLVEETPCAAALIVRNREGREAARESSRWRQFESSASTARP